MLLSIHNKYQSVTQSFLYLIFKEFELSQLNLENYHFQNYIYPTAKIFIFMFGCTVVTGWVTWYSLYRLFLEKACENDWLEYLPPWHLERWKNCYITLEATVFSFLDLSYRYFSCNNAIVFSVVVVHISTWEMCDQNILQEISYSHKYCH